MTFSLDVQNILINSFKRLENAEIMHRKLISHAWELSGNTKWHYGIFPHICVFNNLNALLLEASHTFSFKKKEKKNITVTSYARST